MRAISAVVMFIGTLTRPSCFWCIRVGCLVRLVADTDVMAYRSAAAQPLSRRASLPDHYRRVGLSDSYAAQSRRLGLDPVLAKALSERFSGPQVHWLAAQFSRPALRALLSPERQLNGAAVTHLRHAFDLDASRTRGFATKTTVPVREFALFIRSDVGSQQVAQWQQLHPQSPVDLLSSLFKIAVLMRGVRDEHLSGWLRYANRRELRVSAHGPVGWEFLGGDTALFADAGLAPAEAEALGSTHVDEAGCLLPAARRSFEVMAGLRSGGGIR